MLAVEDFIEAGYKKFNNNNINKSDLGLQKLISDETGKRYYITVWAYDWTKYPQYEGRSRFSFLPDVQLKLQNDMHFNVEMIINPDSTIHDIESFYSEMWEKLNCEYYERWE